MIKLRGQAESGEWVEFWVYDIISNDEVWTVAWCISSSHPDESIKYDDIKTVTIRPAEDLQSSNALIKAAGKQLLDEIRVRLSKTWRIHSTTGALSGYDKQQVDEIIDEMEAKL